MKIDRRTLLRLNTEKRDRIEKATDDFLNNRNESANKHLAWIELFDKILEKNEQRTSMYWSFIIGIILVVLFGLAITLRVPSTNISVDIVTDDISMELAEEWNSKHEFIVDRFFINNLKNVEAMGFNPPLKVQHEEPFEMELTGSDIMFNGLRLGKGASVVFDQEGNELTVSIKGAAIDGEVNLMNAKLRLETDDQQLLDTINVDIPETINFSTLMTQAEPVTIELDQSRSWELRNLKIAKIGFFEETPPGSGQFESTIKSGKINMFQTGTVEEIHKGDFLQLKGIQNRRLEITRENDEILVHLEGNATGIFVGPKGFQKDLSPSLLQYGFYQKRLTFFTSAIVFFWGLLWSLKKSLFRTK